MHSLTKHSNALENNSRHIQTKHKGEDDKDYLIVIFGMKHGTTGGALMEMLEYDIQVITSSKHSLVGFRPNFPGIDGGALRKACWELSGKGLSSSKKPKAKPKKRAA